MHDEVLALNEDRHLADEAQLALPANAAGGRVDRGSPDRRLVRRLRDEEEGAGFGMGLGFAVRTDAGNAKPPPPGSLGELKWDGASGCYLVVDRKQEMFFVLLEQTPSERQRIQRKLKLLVYEALAN